ncbi:Uncharacterised protein [Mycobacteroides abscessus]|nr:Uncharacterised protein [Mycobacteroides abscessus]
MMRRMSDCPSASVRYIVKPSNTARVGRSAGMLSSHVASLTELPIIR